VTAGKVTTKVTIKAASAEWTDLVIFVPSND